MRNSHYHLVMITLVRGGSALCGGCGLSGGGPPRTLVWGGSACPGSVRGVSGSVGGSPSRTSGGPPRTTPQAYLDLRGCGCRSTRRFFPGLSPFLKHFVLPVRVCFSARSRADFHTSRDRFQLFEPLCSSTNSERVIRYEPLLYSKITIRVLRTATTVPTPHIADGGEKLISTATGRTGFCIPY